MHLCFEAFIGLQIMVRVGHSCYRNIEQLGVPEMWSTAALICYVGWSLPIPNRFG